MNRHHLLLRGFQTVAVGAAYGAWLLTQHLLEKRRGSVVGFTDHSHQLISGLNAFFNAHPVLADVVLAVSSFEVDLAAVSLVGFFFARRESRPLLTLWLILIIRQLCQASVSLPPPEGMIWRYPGFPSLVVTYSTSTDFFFSGHMALATALATELTAQRAPRWKQLVGGPSRCSRPLSSCRCGSTTSPTSSPAALPPSPRRSWRVRSAADSMSVSHHGRGVRRIRSASRFRAWSKPRGRHHEAPRGCPRESLPSRPQAKRASQI
jgi:hypothetical protein